MFQVSECLVGLIDCMTEAGSSFQPGDAAGAPLLLTTEGGEAFHMPTVAVSQPSLCFQNQHTTQSWWR